MSETPDAVTRYFEYINDDRFDDLRELFAPEICLEMAGAPRRDGADAAIAYYARALAPLPRHVDDAVDIVTGPPDGDGVRRVAVEIAFSGETADGRAVEFTAVDLFDVGDDGRIRRLRSFYDTALVARMIRPASGD
jgi:ketosteroid isomerase-like protein